MSISHFLRRLHLPLMLLISVFSPLMLFLGRLFPESISMLAVFPAAYVLLAALLVSLPGRMRRILYFACSAMVIALGYFAFSGNLYMMLMPCAGAAALFFALSFAGTSPAYTSPFFYMATLITQFSTLFLFYISTEPGDVHSALKFPLQAVFVIYMLLLLLAFSRISLNSATLSRYRLPDVISRVSAVLTILFFLLALALSSLPAVISGVSFAYRMLRLGMTKILLFILKLFPAEAGGNSMAGYIPLAPQLPGFIEQEPSLFFILFEKAAAVLTFIAVAAGSVILLRLLARLFVRLARHLLDRLQHYAKAAGEDYEDEITDTRQEETDRSFGSFRQRIKRRKAVYPDTPAGKIRLRYARLLDAHSDWKPGSTARENLPEAAAALYERARYSDHPVSRQDAGIFEKETRNL